MLRSITTVSQRKATLFSTSNNSIFNALYKKQLSARIKSNWKIASQLTKFNLSVLNGIVTVGSFALYSCKLSCIPMFVCSVMLSMSSQMLNQFIQIDYDAMMKRTCQRPLVRGLPLSIAKYGGATLCVFSLCGIWAYYGLYPAFIGFVIWASYLFIYTKMKRNSFSNTSFGAIVGSLPVYLGWIASQRSECVMEPFGLFLYMFAWQHQHFYGIRWNYFEDYNQAGFKMETNKSVASGITIFYLSLAILFVNCSLKCMLPTNFFLFTLPVTISILYHGIYSALLFEDGRITPRTFKAQSYWHFLIVVVTLIIASITHHWLPQKQSQISQQQHLTSIYF